MTKANLSAAIDHPSGVGGGLNLHYIGAFDECEGGDRTDHAPARTISAWYKLDLYASYALRNATTGTTTLTVGVTNVADRDPSMIYVAGSNNTDGTPYDLMGRFFHARVTQKF